MITNSDRDSREASSTNYNARPPRPPSSLPTQFHGYPLPVIRFTAAYITFRSTCSPLIRLLPLTTLIIEVHDGQKCALCIPPSVIYKPMDFPYHSRLLVKSLKSTPGCCHLPNPGPLRASAPTCPHPRHPSTAACWLQRLQAPAD